MLPKDRISDQKSVGLGLRIVVSLQASKPGYRGGLGTKLLSCLHTGLDFLVWSLTDCYKNDHKDEVIRGVQSYKTQPKQIFLNMTQTKKSLGKTLPKQLFCHWANRVPT